MSYYQRKDRFYHKAKQEGYSSRAAYKLIEMDRRFGLLKPGGVIVDLGCAPGGWLQVVESSLVARRWSLDLQATSHKPPATVVGIDLLPLKFQPSPLVHFIQGNFLESANQQKIIELIGGRGDWVLSDMSPNLSGIPFKDKQDSLELGQAAFAFAKKVLKTGGGLVVKIFPGPETENFKKELASCFQEIRTFIPESTRKTSTEIYLIAQRFNKT